MSPSDSEFDFLANRLSEDISTVEQQLEDLGADIFSTAELIELRGRFQERLDNFDFFQKKFINLAIWSPLTLLVGGGLYAIGAVRCGLLLITAFPVVLFTCLAGVFLIYQNFGSRGRMENWLELVENELSKRKAARKR
jgi:hypothetical protein